jgi:hypothetical protein
MLRFTSILTAFAWVGILGLFEWPAVRSRGHVSSGELHFAITEALIACGVISLALAAMIRPSRIVVSLLLIISIIAACWAALCGLMLASPIALGAFPLSAMTREAWLYLSEFLLLFILPWLWAITWFQERHALTQRPPTKIFAIAAGLLFVAAAWTTYRASSARSVVLAAPITLQSGVKVSHSFTVDRATSYELKIECQKTSDRTQDLRYALAKGLETEASIATNGRSVRANCSDREHMSFSQGSIARILCTFEAKPRRRYELGLHIVRAGSSNAQEKQRTDETLTIPASAHPMLKIEIDPHNYESDMMTTLLLFFAGSVCLLIAVCIFLIRVLWRTKSGA